MSFLSRGSRRGQGRRRPNIWKEGAKKRIRFSVQFDANSDEFNELIRTGHLFLSGQNLTRPILPAAAAAAPLQPHPSILEEPRMFNLNENKGWDANRNAPYSGNIGWNAPDPNHQHVNTSPCAASVNSSSHSKDNAKNPCSPQPVRPLDLKGKQPLSKSPAGMTEKPHQTPLVSVRSEAPSRMAEKPLDLKGKQPLSKSPSRMAEKPHQTPLVSAHSEADSVREEMKGREDISHLDLFPEISSF